MKEYKLLKDYPIRHDIVMKSGGVIAISDYRAVQLIAAGFIEGKVDAKKARADHIEKAQRKSKVETEND